MNSQSLLTEIQELSKAEFNYSFSTDLNELNRLGYGCSGIVMEAHVLYFEIKNIPTMLKTGRRHATRVYKMYHHALKEVAKETGGLFSCISPEGFLLIYPKEKYDSGYAIDTALKTANLFSKTLHDTIEEQAHVNFSIGIDMGNILCTKVQSDNDTDRMIWVGTAINKAKAIADECNRPFYVGTSGTVFQHLDENHRYTTKKILGIKKQVEIWTTVSYQFENVKKHLHQTNLLKSFEDQ
ncbi:MAG: hypothetical protein IKM95_01690 [Bacteroidales bacterium]|nr:hypothetical protein [Bacteroidales bacterium]